MVDAPEEPLTNLPFADDLLLIAQIKSDARKMLLDLQVTASSYGLQVHMGKTKILAVSPTKHEHVVVAGILVRILAGSEFDRYPGKKLSFLNFMLWS